MEENKVPTSAQDAQTETASVSDKTELSNTGDQNVDAFLNGETDKLPDGTEEISEAEAKELEQAAVNGEEAPATTDAATTENIDAMKSEGAQGTDAAETPEAHAPKADLNKDEAEATPDEAKASPFGG